jgi:hypothetical protein
LKDEPKGWNEIHPSWWGSSEVDVLKKILAETVQIYYGGIYANIAILDLAMYWLVRRQPREPASIFC